MDDPYLYRRFLLEVTRRMFHANPHLLARWSFPITSVARQEDEPGSAALRPEYGAADEKKGAGGGLERK